jgi:hypothetical protein
MPPKRTMRYEIMWERESTLPEVISNAWGNVRRERDLGEVACSLKWFMAELNE